MFPERGEEFACDFFFFFGNPVLKPRGISRLKKLALVWFCKLNANANKGSIYLKLNSQNLLFLKTSSNLYPVLPNTSSN